LSYHRLLIKAYQDVLVELDFIRAKALLAVDLNALKPQLSKYPTVELYDAYHPVLVLQNRKAGKPVVPLTCRIDHKQRLIIISGPNAGGKSISLKTIGLLQLMLQSGLLVPVKENSVMGIFNSLMADIGDNQSIEYELSTYSSRLRKMDHFLKFADKRTLLLIDEFGTGTDPELGGALAEVLLEEFERMNVKGVITTHYANIKLAADRLTGTLNASMVFDDETLAPLYQLKIGQPGSSYTFVIAEKSGIPKAIIERAKSKVSKDKVALDRMLIDLQKKQQDLQNQLRLSQQKEIQAELSKQRFDELNTRWKEKLEAKKANQETLNKQLEAGRKFQQLVSEWDKSKDKKAALQKIVKALIGEKKKKIETQQEKKQLKVKTQPNLPAKPITVGSKVRLLNGKQTGIVEEIIDNKVYVTFGLLKTVTGIDKLQLVEP
jgi:DNA mismatch repair protein MutS2